jgi:osmotically-inducible protein OsmY
MNISSKNRIAVICANLGPVVCALGGFATWADAQNSAAPAADRSNSSGASTTQDAESAENDKLRNRVAAALHADPYFYDEHVTVSVEKGAVVLRGFVFSAWDLRDALRIARKAAGGKPVIDNLSIKLGGRQ